MSIASRITSIEGHIEEDYNALTRLGADLTNVDKNIENIANVVNDIYDKLPKVTGTGSDLSLTPTLQGKISIIPKGNTEQDSYTGKNLCNSFSILNNTSIRMFVNKGLAQTFNISLTPTYTTSANIVLFLDGTNKGNISNNFSMTNGTRANVTITLSNSLYTELQNAESIQIRIYNSSATFTLPKEVMVENNSTATTYEKYVGGIPSPNPDYPQDIRVVTGENQVVVSNSDNTQSQSYTLHLGSLELCKIGDYQDVITGSKDNWKVVRNIQKLILNGTENWKISGNQFYIDGSGYVRYSDGGRCYCNYFIGSALDNVIDTNLHCWIGNANFLIIKYTDITTVEDFKTWLSTHNTTTYYPLSTPIEETITDTSVIQSLNELNDLMSYDGTTNIVITSNSANAQLTAQISALKGE